MDDSPKKSKKSPKKESKSKSKKEPKKSPKKDKKEPKKTEKSSIDDSPLEPERVKPKIPSDCSVFVEIDSIDCLIPIFDSFKGVASTVVMRFSYKNEPQNDGIYIIKLDTSRTAIARVYLSANLFGRIYCDQEEYSMGISVEKMCKILKSVDRDCSMVITYKNADKGDLHIETSDKGKFKLNIMDSPNDGEPPNIKPHVAIRFDSERFHSACSNIKSWPSSYIEFQCDEQITLLSENGDWSKEFGNDDDIEIKYNGKAKSTKNKFELDNVLMFLKCKKLCDKVKIYLSQDKPIIVHYEIPIGDIKVFVSHKNETNISASFNDAEYGYTNPQAKSK